MELQKIGLTELSVEEIENTEGGFLFLVAHAIIGGTIGLAALGLATPWIAGWNAYE